MKGNKERLTLFTFPSLLRVEDYVLSGNLNAELHLSPTHEVTDTRGSLSPQVPAPVSAAREPFASLFIEALVVCVLEYNDLYLDLLYPKALLLTPVKSTIHTQVALCIGGGR